MSHLKINRRDLVKLGVTVGIASALGAPIVKLVMSQSAQREVAAPSGARYIPIFCSACGSKCGLYFVRNGDAMYILPNPS
ncbi:MAG: hypothetical protein RXR01_04015, partial [Thermoproteus sp.]